MKNVCRFNLENGGVLEVEPDKVERVTLHKDGSVRVQVGVIYHAVDHPLEEARAIVVGAKKEPETVEPEYRQSLLDAAIAIKEGFNWADSREGWKNWDTFHGRLIELGRGEPL